MSDPAVTVPPVLLIPGLNNSASSWTAVAERLAADDALDVRPVDCPPLVDLDAIADAVIATADVPSVLVGHSFGGYVALAILARHPDRVAGVVLVNSGTGADTAQAAIGRRERARQAADGEYPQLAAAAATRAYHPDHVGDPDLMAARQRSVDEYGAERYAAHQLAAAERPDRTGLLARSDVPRLVVAASHDVVIPTERQRQDAAAIGAEVHIVDGAGHMVPAEQPAALAAIIAEFVATLAPSADTRPSTEEQENR